MREGRKGCGKSEAKVRVSLAKKVASEQRIEGDKA